MKLDNKKNVILCTKALYAEQLKCYASLCQCYKELATNLGRNATSEDVQKKYAPYLSLATQGDLSFLEKENNYVFSEAYLGARFQNKEAKIFREYAKQTKRLYEFKNAASIISKMLVEDDIPHSQKIDNYKNYMKATSSSTRKFDKEISEHSPTYIGHNYYLTTRQAIRDIRQIDPSHLDGIPVSMEMAPHQFGANISGATTIDKIIEITNNNSHKMDTNDELSQYAKRINPILEHGYRFWAKNQKGVTLSLAAIMSIGLATGVVSQLKQNHDYNNLSIENLEENGYKSDLSSDTIRSIQELEQLIQEAQTQSTIPDKEQLMEIGNTIDDLFDDILEEKLAPSFLETHPGSKDIEIDHYYNFQNSADNYKAIIISYTDNDGKKQEERITNFSSAGLTTPNDVSDLFEHEYKTDISYVEINNIFSRSSNYIDNGKDVQDILNEYNNSLNFMKRFAALDLNYKNGSLMGFIKPSVKADFPEKEDSKQNQNPKDYDEER